MSWEDCKMILLIVKWSSFVVLLSDSIKAFSHIIYPKLVRRFRNGKDL